ncbi:hypothetical protein [Legionella gresilensis]|uniref:hypothetical protein n=1 Tax=Legionella gresilensis TaxID=91823 RepID=UPI001041ACC1|nr:hypothetical protein [Legionella gresilensis]
MLKKYILNTLFYLTSLSLSSFAVAAAATDMNAGSTTNTATSSSVTSTDDQPRSKDEWLSKMREVVPGIICKNFTQNEELNKRLKAENIDYDKCVSLIPASFDKCKSKYYSDLPATMDKDSASKWGKTIGECIGTDFALTNFGGESSTTDKDSSAQEMTKDEWLSKLKAVVPDLICKGFMQDEALNKRLTEVNINYDKCVSLIPESVDKCQKELYSQIPATINQQNAGKWGHSIGECIGKDFALKHLFNKKP